jgi:glutathione S-transferase
VPYFEHGSLRLYESTAIARYVDSVFDGSSLQPDEPRLRARMDLWISATMDYLFDDLFRAIVLERLLFPAMGPDADKRFKRGFRGGGGPIGRSRWLAHGPRIP